MTKKTVAVIGAGTMGAGIAQVFARVGYDVRLIDQSPRALDDARARINDSLGRFAAKGQLPHDEVARTAARIHPSTTLADAADAEIVIEAIIEDPAAKRALLAELDRLALPHALLASNTSSVSITSAGSSRRRASSASKVSIARVSCVSSIMPRRVGKPSRNARYTVTTRK